MTAFLASNAGPPRCRAALLLFLGVLLLSNVVVVGAEDGVVGFSDAPSLVPSSVPSDVPSLLPSDAPSLVPSAAPSPTSVRSDFPSLLPTVEPAACIETTFWAYQVYTTASGSAAVPLRISNNTATCITAPYNIEVRPCNATVADAVQVRLVRTKGRQIVHESRPRPRSPFFLYGPKVSEESKQLPNGAYYVSASPRENGWGRLVFTQQCGAAAVPKGGGQMMMMARRLRPNRN